MPGASQFFDRHDSLALPHHHFVKKIRLPDSLELQASWTIGGPSQKIGLHPSDSRQDFLSFVVIWLRGSHEFSCHRLSPPNRPCRGQTGKGRAADVRRFLSQASVDARAVLRAVRACFDRIPGPTGTRDFSLPVGLTSGLAVFSPGIPSLLQSGRQVRGGEDPVRARNLRALFGVGKAPSDTRMRERLDEAGPRGLRRCGPGASTPPCSAGRCWRAGRRSAGVSRSRRTGPAAAPRTRPSAGAARVRTRRDGSRTSCHQALGAATVRPDHAGAFPPAPEPVRNEDGRRRNDCEPNALRRLAGDLRREHPHMKAVVVEDGLASNGPHVMLRERRRASARPGREAGRPRAAVRLARCQRDEGDMGEARREDRHRAPLRTGPRPAGRRRELRPEDRHARMRGDRHEREGPEVLAGRRPPARPGHGVSVMRCGRRRRATGNETFRAPGRGRAAASGTAPAMAETAHGASS